MRELTDLLVDLRTASRTHLMVRIATALGALLFLAAFVLAGGGNMIAWTGVLGLTGLVVLQPHTLAPGLFLLFGVASWWATVEAAWHWALLPAALGLLVVHSGAAMCASAPPQAPLPASVLRTWATRVGLVSAVTVGVWAAAGLLALRTGPGLGTIPGIVGLAVLATGLMAYLRWRARPGIPT